MGLDIGAKTAGEIAVSALAEAIGGTGLPLRAVKDPYPLVALRGEIAVGECSWRPA